MKVTSFSQVANEVVKLYYKGFTNRMICEYIHYGNINSLSQFFLRLEMDNLITKISIEDRRKLLIKNIKNLVIEDFNKGMSINELSKKYHVYSTIIQEILKLYHSNVKKNKKTHKLEIYNEEIKKFLLENPSQSIKELWLYLNNKDNSITYDSVYYYINNKLRNK